MTNTNPYRERQKAAKNAWYHRNKQQVCIQRMELYWGLPLNSITEEDDGFHARVETLHLHGITLRDLGRELRKVFA